MEGASTIELYGDVPTSLYYTQLSLSGVLYTWHPLTHVIYLKYSLLELKDFKNKVYSCLYYRTLFGHYFTQIIFTIFFI